MALAAPSIAQAAPDASALQLQVLPASGAASSYFTVSGRPGTRVRAGTLRLFNRAQRPISVLLDPVDGATASTLGSTYLVPGLPIHGATRWTRLSTRKLTITPGGSVGVAVATRVPKHTAAGEYLTGISVEVAHQHATRKVGSNVAISSVIRYAIGLEVRVPGPLRPRIVLTGARLERRPAGLTFLLDASNPGNKILRRVTGTIVVTRPGGIAAHAVIGPGTFVSDTSIEYPVPAIGEVPVQGTVYSLHARMRYGQQVVRLDRRLVFGARLATVQHQFGGPPPQPASTGGGVPVAVVIGIVAGMVLAFGLVLVVLLRRQRVHRADS